MQVGLEIDYVFNLSNAYQLPVDYHLTHGFIHLGVFLVGGLTGMNLKQNSCFVCQAYKTFSQRPYERQHWIAKVCMSSEIAGRLGWTEVFCMLSFIHFHLIRFFSVRF